MSRLSVVPSGIFNVCLLDCRWTLQELSFEHMFPSKELDISEGPIVVSRMNDNMWFVHDGRHRCIRALLRGEYLISARNLY